MMVCPPRRLKSSEVGPVDDSNAISAGAAVTASGVLAVRHSFPSDEVIKYAPTFRFHEYEWNFPCSIEYLASNGGSLNQRNWIPAQKIGGQNTSTPALAVFKDKLVMVYKSTEILCALLAAFKDRLYMVYTGEHSAQLYYTSTLDGTNWNSARVVPGQSTSVPSIVGFHDYLLMAYSDSNNSQLWQTQAIPTPGGNDGELNWTNTKHIGNQFTSIPAITVFKDQVVMVYTDSNDSQLWVSLYDGTNWHSTRKIDGQHTSIPALTVTNDWLVMTYSDANSSQFWCTRSGDGLTWQDTVQMEGQHGNVPAIAALRGVVWMTYSDAHSSQLWVTGSSCAARAAAPITPVTQASFRVPQDSGWYIQISDSQRGGQKLGGSPLYYAVQLRPDGNEAIVTYVLLYGYQDGQTLRITRGPLSSPFDCAVYTLGSHYGDLERVSVFLKNDEQGWQFRGIQYEAHGNSHPDPSSAPTGYTRDQIQWDGPGSTHAVVLVGLRGHGCWNTKGPDIKTNPYRVVTDSVAPILEAGDYFGDPTNLTTSVTWRPWLTYSPSDIFKRLGSDEAAVANQTWSLFSGRLGQHTDNVLNGTVMLPDGSSLSGARWAFIKNCWTIIEGIGKANPDWTDGDGPGGPADRPWINPTGRPWN